MPSKPLPTQALLGRLLLCGAGLFFLFSLTLFIQWYSPHPFLRGMHDKVGWILTTALLGLIGWPLFRMSLPIGTPVHRMTLSILFTMYGYSSYITFLAPEPLPTYFDAVLLILFTLCATHYLEALCHKRTAKMIQKCHHPLAAPIKRIQADNQYHSVPIQDIAIGDRLYIGPGDYFPVNGIIQENNTNVNESLITGKAHAVPKFRHDRVLAGTYNLDNAVVIEATSHFYDSCLGKILEQLRQSSLKPYHTTFLSDHIAILYPTVFFTFCAMICCWWLPHNISEAFHHAAYAMMVTCPHLLAITYPLTCASFLERGIQKGILIRNPLAFLHLSQVSHIVWDKTGTLTEPHLTVCQTQILNGDSPEVIWPLIAEIEKNTHHPIAEAIVRYANQHYPFPSRYPIQSLSPFPGKGIRAVVADKIALIGSPDWLAENGVLIAPFPPYTEDIIQVHCALAGVEIARFQLKANIRPQTRSVIQALEKQGITFSIISGDMLSVVHAIARQLGVSRAIAKASPQMKQAYVASLQTEGQTTAMIGDSIHDALALKQAHVSILFPSASTHHPYAAADIVLQTAEVPLIQECYLLSKKAHVLLKQNYGLAILISLITGPLAAIKAIPFLLVPLLGAGILLLIGNVAHFRQ